MSEQTTSGGIGFSSLLTIIFITLKLLGEINWPWIWVLAPTWIPVALVFGIVFLVFIVSLISGAHGKLD